MKRNPEDMISISDLYIGLKLYDLKESSKFDLNMNFAMIQKLPDETNGSIHLYEDLSEEKFYYIKKDGNVVISKKSEYYSLSFKYLKSLEEVLDTCLFTLKNQLPSEVQTYKQAIKTIKEVGFLSIQFIQTLEEYLYMMYCFAYGNPIEKEMSLDYYHNYVIQESFDTSDQPKEKKKNPKDE